jgi:hypothetical protein
MKPICFMIMPYGKKATQAEAGQGVIPRDAASENQKSWFDVQGCDD